MEKLPVFVSLLFILTTAAAGWLFYEAANRNKAVLLASIAWLALQGGMTAAGFYTQNPHSLPPRLLAAVGPPLLIIVVLLVTKGGRAFTDTLSLPKLTLLHTVRIPVEGLLFALCLYGLVPELMTFEGRNFDVLSGITAPAMYYFLFIKSRNSHNSRRWLVVWNLCCLALLLNVVVIAMLSVPGPFQKLSFHQPNVAVLYFPFVWLPGYVVPVVLYAHLAALHRLLRA